MYCITYEKLIPPAIPGNAPTFSAVKTVPSSLLDGIGPIEDVTAASLGSSLYLFVLIGNYADAADEGILELKYSGSDTGGVQVLGYFQIAAYTENAEPYQSIDAAGVTLPSGEQAIVLAAMETEGENSTGTPTRVLTTLVTSNFQAYPQVTFTTNTLHTLFSGPSIRLVYGPGTGTAKTNSCTLFFGASGTSSDPVVETTQINLPPSLETGTLTQAGPWQQLGKPWRNSGNESDPAQCFPDCWTVFPVSLPTAPVNNSASYSNVDQYLAFFELGAGNDGRVNSFVSSLTLQLQVDPATKNQSWPSAALSNYSATDQKSVVQSWNLLGVITGIPPLPAGTLDTNASYPILRITYSNSATTGAGQTSQRTIAASASLGGDDSSFNASAGYSNSTTQGSESSSTFSLTTDEIYPPDSKGTYDYLSNTGFLIVSQPTYYTSKYHVYAYDGTTPLGISTVSIIANSSSIASIPFYLDQPNKPYPGYPAIIYQSFPTDAQGQTLVAWPHTDDITGWEPENNSLPTLTNVESLFNEAANVYITAEDTVETGLSLTSSQLNSYNRDTTNSVDVGVGISFLGINAGTSGTVTLTSNQQTAFTSSASSQIYYPRLQDSQGYAKIQIQAIFDKVGTAPTSQADWIPTIFSGSQPWILTWQVLSTTPATLKPDMPQTITFQKIGSQTKGATIKLRATASSGLPVTFTHEGPVKITGSTATFTGTGPVAIAAHQAGDTIYLPAKEVRQTFTVSP